MLHCINIRYPYIISKFNVGINNFILIEKAARIILNCYTIDIKNIKCLHSWLNLINEVYDF